MAPHIIDKGIPDRRPAGPGLRNSGKLEIAQQMANHDSARTADLSHCPKQDSVSRVPALFLLEQPNS